VVFGSEHHIFCSGVFENFCPVVRTEHFTCKVFYKVLVFEILTIGAVVKVVEVLICFCLWIAQSPPIPLCVFFIYAGVGGSPRRHRENAPVNKDTELGVFEPGRDGPAVDRVPVGFVLCLRKNRNRNQEQKKDAEFFHSLDCDFCDYNDFCD
jgi:hypothetical protein